MDKTKARELDKFYTKPSVAGYCISKAKEILNFNEYIWLEPSAGSGSFSSQLENCEAYDIFPENDSINKADFLKVSLGKRDYVTIGNPPFGKRSKLAIEFFNKAALYSKAICFVLPNTFCRYSIQSKLDKRFNLVYSESLKEDSFTFIGGEYSLRCVFQIWVRNDLTNLDLRAGKPITSIPDFDIWQHNATNETRGYIYSDWKYATYRQGYKDYSIKFTRDDFDKLLDIVNNTNIQLFFLKPNNPVAEDIFLNKMDLELLASRNLRQKGFGKHDFIEYYLSLKSCES